MNKKVFSLIVALFACAFLLISCSSKGPADVAIKAAETAVNAAKIEAVKIVPDKVKALDASLAAAKEKFAKGDYKAALEEVNALTDNVNAVLAAAKAKKEEVNKKWAELQQGLPKMLDDIQSRVDVLAKARKLPAGITKEKIEEAKTGLAAIKEEWNKAQQSFVSGSSLDAVNVATSVKDKALKTMEALGMSVPAPAPAVAPAPASIPAPPVAPAAVKAPVNAKK
jgi:hypothetical protein